MKLSKILLAAPLVAAHALKQRGDEPQLQVQRTFQADGVGYALFTPGAKPADADALWPFFAEICGATTNLSSAPSPQMPDKFLSNGVDSAALQLWTTEVTGSESQNCLVNATLLGTRVTADATNRFNHGLLGAVVALLPFIAASVYVTTLFEKKPAAPKKLTRHNEFEAFRQF
jgi:hypothetical protein